MAIPSLTPPPAAPSRAAGDAAFSTAGDAFMSWWVNVAIPQLNAAFVAIPIEVNSVGYNGTSTTSLAIGTGSKTFTVQTGKLYTVGQYVIASSTAGVANYMIGQVTAYNSGTGSLTVAVTNVGGSGTFASWSIGLTAAPSSAPFSYVSLGADATGTAAAFETAGLGFAGSVFALNSIYEFEAVAAVKVASGNFAVGLAWPGGVTGSAILHQAGGQPVSGDQSATIASSNNNGTTFQTFVIKGFLATGGSTPTGNLDVQFRNPTGSAIHTMSKGSFIKYRLAA